MDSQTLINLAALCAMGILGWLANELWSAVKELKVDLAKLREEIPKEYIAKDAFKDGISRLEIMLVKIMDRLENKMDK